MKCDNCTEKCPQEEMACEIAKGRMYATDEVIRLQKELEEVRNKTIDEFAEMIELEILTMLTSEQEYRIAKKSLDEIAVQMKGE